MQNTDIKDPLFLKAVEAIDDGNTQQLEELLNENPALVQNPLNYPEGRYFKNPYLLWFVADNPIRTEKLSLNIVEVTGLLLKHVKQQSAENMQFQLDYALALVVTGRTPRECGVQLQMIDLLINEGAQPGSSLGALAQRNIDAALQLIKRGAEYTLPAAAGLNNIPDVVQMLPVSTSNDKLTALTIAAFYGNAAMVKLLLDAGVNPNGYPNEGSGFHWHATPLHKAASSSSLECVQLLVQAGASLTATDKIYNGTPLGWAKYMLEEKQDTEERRQFKEIEEYLEAKL